MSQCAAVAPNALPGGYHGRVRALATFAIALVVTGCEDFVVLTPLPPAGIASLDCSCILNVGQQLGICAVLRCQCGALGAGACAAQPRDEAACQEEVADAIDTCVLFQLPGLPPVTPDRPDPESLDLASLDGTCAQFAADQYRMNFDGSFCVREEASQQENNIRCMDICSAAASLLDFTFSQQSSSYDCNNLVRVVDFSADPGNKEECGFDCPPIPCSATTIDTCTVVQNPEETQDDGTPLCESGFESERFCRMDDADPPQLAAGGLFAEWSTRRSRGILAAPSSFTMFLPDGGNVNVALTGYLDVIGEPCIGCPVSFRLSAHGEDAVSSGASLTKIHVAAGTGTTPVIPLDDSGAGMVPAGMVSGTLSMDVDGEGGFLTAATGSVLGIVVDRVGGTFSLTGATELVRPDGTTMIGDLALTGTLENQPPTVDAGPDIIAECSEAGGAQVSLFAAVKDFNGPADLRIVSWFEGEAFPGVGGGEHLSNWVAATPHAALGTTKYSVVVVDSHLQRHSDSVVVSVIDTTPPTIREFSFDGPPCFWAPSHDLVVLRVDRDFTALIEDACDADPQLVIAGAASDEPDNSIGDGNTATDVALFGDRVCLRAERAGTNSDGRTYTVVLEAVDASHNRSSPEVQIILVPHDQRPESRCQRLNDVEIVEDGDAACTVPDAASAANANDRVASCATSGVAPLPCLILVAFWRRRRRVLIGAAILAASCERPYPFRWEDTLGHVCDVHCDGSEVTCAYDLRCNTEPPTDACAPEDQQVGRPCWVVCTLKATLYEDKLGDTAFGLCSACCLLPDGVSRSDFDETCAPLVCDPDGVAPPLPLVCIPTTGDGLIEGFVHLPEET